MYMYTNSSPSQFPLHIYLKVDVLFGPSCLQPPWRLLPNIAERYARNAAAGAPFSRLVSGTVPISRTTIVTSPSYVTGSSGDGAAEKSRQLRPTPAQQVIIANKIDDQILEKSNNIHEPGSTRYSRNNNTIQTSQSNNTIESSDSVPPPQPRRPREKPTAVDDNNRKGKTAKFDSKIGAVITTVTLIVMLIWGKACAVVCMAAWFYLIPRYYNEELMKLTNSANDGDFDSCDYKKRVVLQGLLDRNRHIRGKILNSDRI
ncbi:UNVERIFIED_CONTAM: hypothetical protein Sangu_2695700 [Sesamum angustifolium]|uniref:Uncharacterized protein n=1 Tax=Sesamum angustifolium TaxID=2727405 RepID=A0AAW2IZ07_9LAMI